jgi:hypothetical protein
MFLLAVRSLHLNETPAVISDWTEETDEALLNLFWHAALFSDVGVAAAATNLQRVSQCLNAASRRLGREGVLGNRAEPCAGD